MQRLLVKLDWVNMKNFLFHKLSCFENKCEHNWICFYHPNLLLIKLDPDLSLPVKISVSEYLMIIEFLHCIISHYCKAVTMCERCCWIVEGHWVSSQNLCFLHENYQPALPYCFAGSFQQRWCVLMSQIHYRFKHAASKNLRVSLKRACKIQNDWYLFAHLHLRR